MTEHPVKQIIIKVDVYTDADGDLFYHHIGRNDVTRIEACTKSGLHSDIPYIRVWADDACLAEYCQHNIIGVYFTKEASHDQA